MDIWNATPDEVLAALSEAGVRRAWLIANEGGGLRASHRLLESTAAAVSADARDYRGHQAVFFEIGRESGHLLAACIHRTRRGQAAGGARFWRYATFAEFVRDGLRLSRGMGQKNALAGLWWGGGKGLIARREGVDHRDAGVRAAIYRDYGRFVSGLRGCYVTAEDAGTTASDMAWVHATTRHTTCIPAELGGSGNPSRLTAHGVVVAMEAALAWKGDGDLRAKTVASQGVGNVARFMIRYLLERGVARVIGVDIDEHSLDLARRDLDMSRVELRHVARDDDTILREECDVLAPNAIGATLNPVTSPGIRAAVVCGAANNQLEDPERDALALAERDILYVPDFLANRMGIVNCANEQYGWFEGDRAILRHLDRDEPEGVFKRCHEVFDRARASGRTPAEEAELLADELSEELHPIWGDRGCDIIAALDSEGWHESFPS